MVLLESQSLELGSQLHHFRLPNACGDDFCSEQITKDIVLIGFICNHCPYVVKIINEFSALAKKYKNDVDFVTISANDPDYREEDSFENMTSFAHKHGFTFPYLFDEDQEVAKRYKAVCTPDLFVFKKDDQQRYRLAYHGRFEDLEKALVDLTYAKEVKFEQLPSIGCSIKWKEDSK